MFPKSGLHENRSLDVLPPGGRSASFGAVHKNCLIPVCIDTPGGSVIVNVLRFSILSNENFKPLGEFVSPQSVTRFARGRLPQPFGELMKIMHGINLEF